jgi:hypothetical protein
LVNTLPRQTNTHARTEVLLEMGYSTVVRAEGLIVIMYPNEQIYMQNDSVNIEKHIKFIC